MLNTGKLAGKTIYVTGASRGIGKAIALKAAKDGARIVVAAKTTEPHPKLPGTIYTAVEESKLNPTTAFMSGKLKMEGNLGKAMALEKVMKKMKTRGYHTDTTTRSSSRNGNFAYHDVVFRRPYSSSSSSAAYESVPEVFDRIKTIANSDVVSKVKATFVFEVDGEGKFFIDFADGDGNVGTGEIPDKPADFKPDVRIAITKENCLKLFNRELQPATAFMTGKLKLTGDLSKAMSLEAVMKASRGEKQFHASAYKGSAYTSVTDVRERIRKVASAKIVGEVNAIYLFDVEDEGKFYVDLKHAEGSVGEGDPPAKADVTIKMSPDVFVKMFNREIAPATAFMSGKIKISGDLTKALTLEKVMKAAREAEDDTSK